MLKKFEKKNGMMNIRVMTDTNILISSILFPGSLPSQLVEEVLLDHKLVLLN